MRFKPSLAFVSLVLLAAGCPGLRSPMPKRTLYANHVDLGFTKDAPLRLHLAKLDFPPDLLTIDQGANALSVVWNDGKGHLSKPQPLDVGTTGPVVDAQVADVVGDQLRPDILALLPTEVVILQNQGQHAFAVPATGGHVAPGTGYRDLLVGDFNGDGATDLFIVGDTGSDLWLGPDFKAAQDPRPPALLPDPAPFVANLDNNVRDDVVGVRQGNSGPELVGLVGLASGDFQVKAAPPLPAGDVVSVIAPVGVRDHTDDVVVGGKGFLAYYANGDTDFWPPEAGTLDGLDPLAVAADRIGDGTNLPDLVVTDRSGKLFTFLSNDNPGVVYSQWFRVPPKSVGPSPTGLAIADMDDLYGQEIVVSTEGTCCPLQDAGVQVFSGGTVDTASLPVFSMQSTQ